MERNKEVIKKPYSDIYESKKIGVSKISNFKSNSHIAKAEDTKTKISYISKSKSSQSAIGKKSSIYAPETKPLYKHSCEQCEVKKNSNLIVNAVPIDHTGTERKLEHCHNLNGSLFNVHSTLCNLTCSVPEISHLNRVLNFQTTRQNELFSKSAKQKQRNAFSEQRSFSHKNPNSSSAFSNCKFPASVPNCNARCHCSKNSSWNANSVDPYFNISTNETVSESIIVNDEFNLKCGLKYPIDSSKDCRNLTDLPVLVHSNFSRDSWEVKYCIENKFQTQISRQRKWYPKTWDQVAVSSDRTVIESQALDKTDKMLFPALPSNSHSQVKLNSSHTSSMPPSEHSSAENSDLESVHSFPDGNVNCTTSFLTSVSSTIPQASYADVIRLSSAGVQGLLAADFEKASEQQNLSHNTAVNSLSDKLQKAENSNPERESSDWVISRLSQIDQNSPDAAHSIALTQSNQNEQNFGAPRPIVVSLEKPSFYNSSLQSNKSVLSTFSLHANLTSPDRKVMDEESVVSDCLCSLEKISLDKVSLLPESMPAVCISDIVTDTNVHSTSLKTDSIYSSPSSMDSFTDAFKPAESGVLSACNFKTKDPPVVIMNNSSSPQSMSEISFGIEYEEMIRLCADSCDTSFKSISSFSLQDADEYSFSENIKSPELIKDSTEAHVQSEVSHSSALESLAAADQCITIRGKKIYWKDSDVDSRYNHQQMAEYFACVWKEFEKDENDPKKNESIYNEL